jgi:hypothetical protein
LYVSTLKINMQLHPTISTTFTNTGGGVGQQLRLASGKMSKASTSKQAEPPGFSGIRALIARGAGNT